MENAYLVHHGIMGQKWGKRNGPPYPLSRDTKKALRKAEKEAAKNRKANEKANKKEEERKKKVEKLINEGSPDEIAKNIKMLNDEELDMAIALYKKRDELEKLMGTKVKGDKNDATKLAKITKDVAAVGGVAVTGVATYNTVANIVQLVGPTSLKPILKPLPVDPSSLTKGLKK